MADDRHAPAAKRSKVAVSSSEASDESSLADEFSSIPPAAERTAVIIEVSADDKCFGRNGKEILKSDVDSVVRSKRIFEWLIAPVTSDEFYEKYFEKRPLIIKRKKATYYDGWFSTKEIEAVLREREIMYGKDIDVTRYKKGERHTYNKEGERAKFEDVWRKFKDNKCSVRVLRPQEYSDSVWQLLSCLEEHWGSGAGSNSYLTPAGAQGFSPHFDDVDVFAMQLEGGKHWRLYHNQQESDWLSRTPSGNFKQEEIGDPFVEVYLEAGDLMYFPRGVIHQARSPDDVHSLHLTISTSYQNTWYDYLATAIPRAMEIALQESLLLRQNVPRDYMSYMGVMYSDRDDDQRRAAFQAHVARIMREIEDCIPLDAAADQMMATQMHSRLPPALPPAARKRCHPATATNKVSVKSEVRLISKNVARMTVEEETAVVYHCVNNPRVYMAADAQFVEFDISLAEGIEYIFTAYPRYVKVADIPLNDEKVQLELVKQLFNAGLLMVKN
eukprot:TRINITY_DN4177_c0_g2_i1.p1 TRINITY_DN4177_c0_g2~~TRINITY_DN4177_c0_g2_i1.p1  ORF type:complete len:500 (-),score=120.33 TRINITY_DN4177_c0_g2_i1:105-1604(-)